MGSLNGEVLNFTSDNPQKFTELKVTFSPKQEGTGDPSPTNVRPITGYSSIDVFLNDKQSETGATKYTIEFPEEAGAVYGGYVDFVNSELVVEWTEWIEDGSRNIPYWPWRRNDEKTAVFALFNGLPSDVQRLITGNHREELTLHESRRYYDLNRSNQQTDSNVYGLYSVTSLSYSVGYPTGEVGETKAELQAYLAEHPEKFVYKLAEPKHYPLNIYKTYRTLLGTNVVWTNGDAIEAEVKDYPQGTTAKTETGSVLNFNTYQPKQLNETKISFTPKQSGSGTPSPENVREIIGKNSVSVWQSNDDRSRPLPKEYQQVEYIGTTGTQWLDTGVVPTVNTKSQIKMSAKEMSGYVFYGLFTGDDATDYRFFISNSRMYWDLPGGRAQTTFGTATTETVYELELGNHYIKDLLTDTYLASKTRLDFELTETITLNSYNGTQFSKSNWYYVKIYESNTLIRDLVPCYRKSDSVAGMYDLVSGTFYTNSGTGEFLVGEDITAVETSVSFPSVGKNLFDGEWRKGRYVDGEWTTTNTWRTSELIPVEPNTTYCVSVNEPRTIGKIYSNLFDKNGNHIGYDYGTSVTTTADTALMTICNTNNVVSAWTDIQLEKGSTATAYEAFDNTVYGGYVDISKGELVAEYACVTLDGVNVKVRAGRYSSNDFYGAGWVYAIPRGESRNTGKEYFCDKLPLAILNSETVPHYAIPYGGKLYYMIRVLPKSDYPDGLTDAEMVTLTNEWLQQNPVTVAYPLLEPIHYSLSPRILTTLQGVNTMWSDGDSLTISYTDDVVNTYDFRRHISLDTPHKASASGAVASFGTDMVGKMKCKIHFTPQQEGSGTPSPDNVRAISGRSSVKLWQSGKNLFDKASAKPGRYESVDGVWTLVENAAWYASDLIRVKPNTRYSVFGGTPLTSIGTYINVYDENMARVTYTTYLSYITTTADAKYLSVHSTTTGSFYKNRDTIMICEGSDAPSEYKPYTGNEITFTFPSTVGDNGVVYGGYLDTENGEVVEEYYTFTLDGTNNKLGSGGTILNGNECEAYAYFGQGTLSGIPRGRGTSYTQLYSNLLPTVRQTSGRGEIVQADDVVNYIRVQLYAETIGVASGATSTEVIDAINTWLTAHPMQVCYPLRDHVHYSLTSQSIATLRGSNRIWSDGDSVEVEYYKHTDEPQEYLPIDAIVTNNGFVLVTSDGYAVGETNDYIKY